MEENKIEIKRNKNEISQIQRTREDPFKIAFIHQSTATADWQAIGTSQLALGGFC